MSFKSNSFVLLLIISLVVFTACSHAHDGEQKTGLLSRLISISDEEDKGVKDILAFYGGYCEYSIGTTVSEKGAKKFFELKMSKSDVIENKFSHNLELPASNCAYILYRNLKNEQNKYDEINVDIILRNGKQVSYEYPVNQLKIVVQKWVIKDTIISILNAKNYEKFAKMFDTLYFKPNSNFVENLTKLDSTYGAVTNYLTYGFIFTKVDNSKMVLHLSGALLRKSGNHVFSIDLDTALTSKKILYLTLSSY